MRPEPGTNGALPEPAPLPGVLWKSLVERYIDPDEGKSYKDVGPLERLGTKAASAAGSRDKWSPEVRLSHYFSQVLYPQIKKEWRDGAAVQRAESRLAVA